MFEILILMAILLILYYYFWAKPYVKSLYNRIGEIEVITQIINNFYDKLIEDSQIGSKFVVKSIKVKFIWTLWLASISKGPFIYTLTTNKYKISKQEYNVINKILEDTLDNFKINNKDKDEILLLFDRNKENLLSYIV